MALYWHDPSWLHVCAKTVHHFYCKAYVSLVAPCVSQSPSNSLGILAKLLCYMRYVTLPLCSLVEHIASSALITSLTFDTPAQLSP